MMCNRTTSRARHLSALVLAVLLLGLSACGGDDGGSGGESSASGKAQKKQSEGTAAAGPDLGSVPDVVAEVNGEQITKDDFAPVYQAQFQQMSMQAQASGKPVDQDQLKQQIVQNLVGTELLLQEAGRRDITATKQDTNRALKDLAKQNGLGSVDKLMAAFQQQGMGPEQVQAQVRDQVKVDRLVADEAGGLSVSEKEARTLYEQMKQQQAQAGAGQKVPPFSQVRDQLEQQVKSQKQSQVAQRLVSNLRDDADVVVNL